jgi:hypothetical protein
MATKATDELRGIFAAQLRAFADEPTWANFGRYRIASLVLDIARGDSSDVAVEVKPHRRREETRADVRT